MQCTRFSRLARILMLCAALCAALGAPGLTFAAAEESAEAGLDLTLRTKAAGMPVLTRDGSAQQSPASHLVLMDYDTGAVLASKAADQPMYPSSMTKMMTLYLIFDKLKQGTLSMDTVFPVSEKAWRMQGSKMFVPLGAQVKLEDLIRGIAIQSGNDACIVAAEGIAGSEETFAQQMNERAKTLGMTGSHFVDGSGWPNPAHLTTAHDLALLAVALIRDFPQYYHFFSEREYVYNNIRQYNRNLLLANPSLHVDGLKTGHTDAAGYGITLSARDPVSGRRLVLVLNGLDSESARANEGARLLAWGFQAFETLHYATAGQKLAHPNVWDGTADSVALVPTQDVKVIAGKVGRDQVKATIHYPSVVMAPVKQGQPIGTLEVTLPDGAKESFPLVAAQDVAKLSFVARVLKRFGL